MKKFKLLLMTAAIVMGVGVALATTAKAPCESQTQYWKYGNEYYPAGIEGYDYECAFDHFGTCTYYYYNDRIGYLPCKSGKILWIR